MNTTLSFTFLILLAFPVYSGCGTEGTGPMQADEPSAEIEIKDSQRVSTLAPATPRMEDGVQVIDVAVGATLEPGALRLAIGVPARLVLTRMTDDTCVKEILIPALEIGPVDLPLGEAVAIEFTPTEAGEFTFVCGMDMETGLLVVQS